MSWGNIIEKIFDWIPGRKEHYRNKIEDIKRRLYELQKSIPFTTRDADEYMQLSSQLRKLEQKTKND